MVEDLGVLGTGEVPVLTAGRHVLSDHAVNQLLETPLPLRGADRAAEVLGGDDVGGVDGPEFGEFDTTLLEVDGAVPPVGHDDIAALPGDLVVRVHALPGVNPPDRESLARALAPARRRAAHRLRHVHPPSGIPADPTRARPGPSVDVKVRTPNSKPELAAQDKGRQRARVLPRRAQRGNLILEISKRLKPPVDRGEPQVSHLVQVAERPENRQAHLMRSDLTRATGPDRILDLLGQDRELVFGDRPALAGPLDPADDLLAGERLGGAAALAHHQDDRLLGGETPPACRARPASADRSAIIGGPAVDDTAFRVLAVRAEHAITSPGRPGACTGS